MDGYIDNQRDSDIQTNGQTERQTDRQETNQICRNNDISTHAIRQFANTICQIRRLLSHVPWHIVRVCMWDSVDGSSGRCGSMNSIDLCEFWSNGKRIAVRDTNNVDE